MRPDNQKGETGTKREGGGYFSKTPRTLAPVLGSASFNAADSRKRAPNAWTQKVKIPGQSGVKSPKGKVIGETIFFSLKGHRGETNNNNQKGNVRS